MTSYSYGLNKKKTVCPTGGFVMPEEVDFVFSNYKEYKDSEDSIYYNQKSWIVNNNGRGWEVYKKKDSAVSLKLKSFDELTSFDSSILDVNDCLYVQRITKQMLYNFNDPNNLINSSKTSDKSYIWAVLKYNGDKETSAINSGIKLLISDLTTHQSNTLVVYQGTKIAFSNGFDSDGNKQYDELTLDSDIKITITKNTTKYIALSDDYYYYEAEHYYNCSESELPSSPTEKDIWYDESKNLTYTYIVNKTTSVGSWQEYKVKIIAEVLMNNGDVVRFRQKLPYDIERLEEKLIDINAIKSCYLVDNDTDETLSKVQLYDPIQCVIPNGALSEVDYITEFDPANYNDDNMWDSTKVGCLWWDLSKVKYVDYHQGDLLYKRNNWGKQLTGSEIAIMEWTKSESLPEDENTLLTGKYVTKEEFDPTTLLTKTSYYFWVKNPLEIPDNNFRKRSAFEISSIINSPQDMGIIWLAPIDIDYENDTDSSFIVGNFNEVSADKNFVVQLNMQKDSELNEHEEWIMIKENTSEDIPEYLWNKMKASLKGIDENNQVVPAEDLDENDRYGIDVRPNQTMFKDLKEARHNFVDVVNDIFASRDITEDLDIDDKNFQDMIEDDSGSTSYEYFTTYSTYYEMKTELKSGDENMIGKYVKVEEDENYNGIWTIYLVKTLKSFELVDYQKYKFSKYYEYINLYKDDTIKLLSPIYIKGYKKIYETDLVNLIADGYEFRNGDVLKVYDTDEKWSLRQYSSELESFVVVGKEDAAIQLNDNLYTFMSKYDEDDETIFIDNLNMYNYLNQEAQQIIEKIISYFEK